MTIDRAGEEDAQENEQDLATVDVEVQNSYCVSTRARRALNLGRKVGMVLECSEEAAVEILQKQINSHKPATEERNA